MKIIAKYTIVFFLSILNGNAQTKDGFFFRNKEKVAYDLKELAHIQSEPVKIKIKKCKCTCNKKQEIYKKSDGSIVRYYDFCDSVMIEFEMSSTENEVVNSLKCILSKLGYMEFSKGKKEIKKQFGVEKETLKTEQYYSFIEVKKINIQFFNVKLSVDLFMPD